ncbi:MAG TPA: N-acetylmuramic acid 6-phosphate etherase [Pseudonocardiaceae bacterium]|nr:N-acetylmuramic acid 6-phosphate etherase [Pseudonocardiaceae bacterium]
MSLPPPGRVLAADLGKTSCRVGLVAGGVLVDQETGAGTPGLAEPTGVAAATAAIVPLVRLLSDRCGLRSPAPIGIGAAGALYSVDGPRRLAAAILAATGAGAAMVTSDAITAHAGALGGLPGVVQLAGTGAATIGIAAGGGRYLVDGWGPWLGDEGSGGWIGLAGLRAAVRTHDGRAEPTALLDAAVARFGEPGRLPSLLVAEGNPARVAASFAPDVVRVAAAGDAVAGELLAVAGAALARGTLTAVRAIRADGSPDAEPTPVVLIGGLASLGEVLLEHWRSALAGSPVRVLARPLGDALVGAAMLAVRTDLPHEPSVYRSAQRVAVTAGPPRLPTDPRHTDELATEQVRPGLEDLDTRPAREVVELLLGAEAAVPAALAAAAPALAEAVDLVADRLRGGGRLVYAGAGTPGRLAALDAAEVGPTFGVPPGVVISIIAGGADARLQAFEGAEDDDLAGGVDLAAHDVGPGDVVVGVSASGRTPYVLGALTAARAAGAATVAVVNNPGSPIAAVADITVEVRTGAEVIAGSTRLTAGTAQKIVLNVLSTAAMVRLGRTFGAWMVDVQTRNQKLRRRAVRILREATGAAAEDAERALAETGGDVRTALVALLLDVDARTARTRLASANGQVRQVLGSKLTTP